tara:strand:+ start:249 stop:950 length:702 start_codon:yes stop_codon:yes gene_type:complete
MWYDRDIDAIMSRTKARAIPSGKVTAEAALTFGVLLAGGSVMVMGLAINWVAATLLMVTIMFYVFIYTIWLKRRTPQNIVIGGAAGAFPPMIGWAAATGTVSVESITLFTIIFIWTPPHFWALSLYKSDDYKAAGVPMMPLVHGRYETKKQILLYSIVLGPLGIVPFWLGTLGAVYGATAALLGALFIGTAWRVMRDDSDKNCKQLFGFSIFYLFLLFLAMIVDRCVDFNPIS